MQRQWCFVALQLRLWIGEGSLADIWRLQGEIKRRGTEDELAPTQEHIEAKNREKMEKLRRQMEEMDGGKSERKAERKAATAAGNEAAKAVRAAREGARRGRASCFRSCAVTGCAGRRS